MRMSTSNFRMAPLGFNYDYAAACQYTPNDACLESRVNETV